MVADTMVLRSESLDARRATKPFWFVCGTLPVSRFIFAALVFFAVCPAEANTVNIPISLSESHFGLPDFYTLSTTFTLPTGYSNAMLSITTFTADDRAVLELNGTIVASTGLFGPGPGDMVLTSGGSNDPFTFEYGNSGPFTPITTGFISGLNTLLLIVNDTNTGISGNLSGGINCGFANCLAPTSVTLDGAISFDQPSAVPLPSGLPLFATGLGVLGLLGWRRKRKQVA